MHQLYNTPDEFFDTFRPLPPPNEFEFAPPPLPFNHNYINEMRRAEEEELSQPRIPPLKEPEWLSDLSPDELGLRAEAPTLEVRQEQLNRRSLQIDEPIVERQLKRTRVANHPLLIEEQKEEPFSLKRSYYDPVEYLTRTKSELELMHLPVYKRESDDEDLVKEALTTIMRYEIESEELRKQLILQEDFNLIVVLKSFDSENEQIMSVQNVEQGLKKYGLNADEIDVQMLVARESSKGGFSLSQEDFFIMFLPHTIDNAQQNESLFIDKKVYFSNDTNEMLKDFLRCLLNLEVEAEEYRNKLNNMNIKLQATWTKVFGQTQLNEQQLRDYLLENGLYVRREEIGLLFSRFDKNNKGIIEAKDFEYEFTPFEKRFAAQSW